MIGIFIFMFPTSQSILNFLLQFSLIYQSHF